LKLEFHSAGNNKYLVFVHSSCSHFLFQFFEFPILQYIGYLPENPENNKTRKWSGAIKHFFTSINKYTFFSARWGG
jgi:hypothetical protein